MYQKTLTLILAFAMLFSIGYGVTGFYTLDSESLCVEESDCSYSVCCPLSGKEYGVCEQESECSQIYLDSQSSSGAVLSAQKAPLQENVERSYIAVSLGILLLLILAIVGYLEWKQEKKTLQRKRVKR
ncbi:MAG: hypothetical protein QT08_C0017G0024 [archaeon GW2011_AR17]|nr:MAG: hypothetical protein QT08_C0017G0024 [archaeon GW2011_AR17]MBS3154384.1 hypothetical protein [Candidatus Woesearchaeota archaeon]HIH15405.1 hypothetical protein [Nanoarchaeota archaeon]HIH58927.1 hypothetical protein [Nanoarchaeota archaeon]HII13967.1 hypothetical protein [Nanoarchaeota archaeon]